MQTMRKRYIALKIENSQFLDEKRLMNAIWGKVYELFGEVGASQTALSKIRYDKEHGIIVLRCSHKRLDEVVAAVSALTEINHSPVVPRILAISGTLKALKNKLSR
jgi:RNase P/RNase MRP subunit POP5